MVMFSDGADGTIPYNQNKKVEMGNKNNNLVDILQSGRLYGRDAGSAEKWKGWPKNNVYYKVYAHFRNGITGEWLYQRAAEPVAIGRD